MEENILIKLLGDSHVLKVMGFFLDHPLHSFTITKLQKYTNISRETIKKDLEFYEKLGYIIRTSNRGPYKLKLNNNVVQMLIRFNIELAHMEFKKEITMFMEECITYKPNISSNKNSTFPCFAGITSA